MKDRVNRHLLLRLSAILALAAACLLAGGPAPARAATLTVNTIMDESDGSCADGDCSLRDALDTAAAGDTIGFTAGLAGQTIMLTVGQLDIDRSLAIDGSGLAEHVRISGSGAFRVLAVHGSVVVTLRSLDLADGQAPADGLGGGGITNEGDLTVTGCTIADNTTADNGGGIHNFGVLTVNGGSVLSGNSAAYGGGIRNDNGSVTVSDSTITGNSADFGGGGDNYAGSMTLANVTVEENTANHYGGGMTTGASALVEDSIFRANSAERGGGIDSHEAGVTLTLARCTLTGNTSTWDGGALLNDGATLEVSDSRFDANSAGTSGGGSGGAIFNTAVATLTGCTISGNAAPTAGGGIFNQVAGTLTINGGALTGNTAAGSADGYGGAIENSGALELNNCTVAGNTALYNGGAIENWGGDLTVTGCTFAANESSCGGAINNNAGGTAAVIGSTFVSNAATGPGGGLYNDNSSTLTLENSTLSANSASGEGGGIDNVSGTLAIDHCTLYGNAADFGGGISNRDALDFRNTYVGGSPTGGDCGNNGTIGDNTGNLVEDDTCTPLLSGGPGLDALADNGGPTRTHALPAGSPAIDAASAATCPAADQRGTTRPADGDADGAETCDIGAFELGEMQCGILAAAEPADYLFLGEVNVRVVDQGADLDCLRVTDVPPEHPDQAPALKTGKYWRIAALAADGSTAAQTGYSVELTLPDSTADSDSRVCRYTGDGWDCAATGYVALASVTREGVGELSDWAVGAGDCSSPATPEPEIGLTGLLRREVLLTWTDDPANAGGYRVHRSAAPYFTPGPGTLQAVRPAGATACMDAGAAGAPGAHYVYIVLGVGNCGAASAAGPRLGVFSFGLTPGG